MNTWRIRNNREGKRKEKKRKMKNQVGIFCMDPNIQNSGLGWTPWA